MRSLECSVAHRAERPLCVLHDTVSPHSSSKLPLKGFCCMLINEDKEKVEILVEAIVSGC